MLDTQLDDVPMVLAELGNSRNHKRCKDFKTLLLKSQEHGRIADIPFIDENTLLFNKSLLVIQLLLCVVTNQFDKKKLLIHQYVSGNGDCAMEKNSLAHTNQVAIEV
ncbi:hypothetical protein T4D_13448 [Trichinella pseudospiralis]|uniref:Uncharacterized protein n=1 Tax=Trichinella pseudospiralis TaxID=6337 RepID=A0A0V1FIR0_TRIPS|nr:hypothetical protein T4D_13448 [Trichinella pseudospiralis]